MRRILVELQSIHSFIWFENFWWDFIINIRIKLFLIIIFILSDECNKEKQFYEIVFKYMEQNEKQQYFYSQVF